RGSHLFTGFLILYLRNLAAFPRWLWRSAKSARRVTRRTDDDPTRNRADDRPLAPDRRDSRPRLRPRRMNMRSRQASRVSSSLMLVPMLRGEALDHPLIVVRASREY